MIKTHLVFGLTKPSLLSVVEEALRSDKRRFLNAREWGFHSLHARLTLLCSVLHVSGYNPLLLCSQSILKSMAGLKATWLSSLSTKLLSTFMNLLRKLAEEVQAHSKITTNGVGRSAWFIFIELIFN